MQTNTQDNDTSNVSEKSEQIREYGQVILKENNSQHHIFLLSIIGEIEGHEQSPGNVKTTKYEHVLPLLAMAEDNQEIDGILVLLNTMGGDVEAGLAIAEMIASISKPTVSLVLGGQPFYWCPPGCFCGLFIYCPQRNNDHPSCTNEWHGDRRHTDL